MFSVLGPPALTALFGRLGIPFFDGVISGVTSLMAVEGRPCFEVNARVGLTLTGLLPK
jgi:hypothetical protein